MRLPIHLWNKEVKMSVPANLRNVKDTESNSKCESVEACSELFDHAVKCCKTSKVEESIFAFLANGIIQQSLEIYLDAYGANRVPYRSGQITEDNYNERRKLILRAMKGCSNLEGLVTLGKRSFHWRNKKIKYWVGLTVKTGELLSHWLRWCENEYSNSRTIN